LKKLVEKIQSKESERLQEAFKSDIDIFKVERIQLENECSKAV
jgi:hypothetical protein